MANATLESTVTLTPTQRQTLALMAGYAGFAGLAADFGATDAEMEDLFWRGLVMRRIEGEVTFWAISNAGMQAVTSGARKVRG